MNILDKVISERRGGIKQAYQGDFLQQMLMEDEKASSTDEAPRLTDAEIKDNILTMIIAG